MFSVHARAQERTGRDFPKGLDVKLEYSYYNVPGASFEEIYRALESRGPEVGGRTFYALTGVETGFRYRHVENGPTCALADVGVQARVVMRIPQWTGGESARPDVSAAWERFLDRLMYHEAEHYRIIEAGARRIYNALRDLRVHSCDVADAHAQQIIKKISDEQAEANEQLDRDTGHGSLEGAVWPPKGYATSP
jgi:predicted secreted Zn-dependent protease